MYLQSSCTVWEKWKCCIPQIVFHQPAKECPPPLHIPRVDIFTNQLKHTIKKKWTGMQNDVVQPNVNEVKQWQEIRPNPSKKKVSFYFTSLLSNVLQLLPYMIIYLQKGGKKRAMHDSCFKKKRERERGKK